MYVIQVQHTHMTDTAAADTATVELIVNTLHQLFPAFDYRFGKFLQAQFFLGFMIQKANFVTYNDVWHL